MYCIFKDLQGRWERPFSILNAAFSAGSLFAATLHATADRGNAAADPFATLFKGVTRLVGDVASALRQIVARFLTAHRCKENAQAYTEPQSKQKSFHAVPP
jgi:hypothetical protein